MDAPADLGMGRDRGMASKRPASSGEASARYPRTSKGNPSSSRRHAGTTMITLYCLTFETGVQLAIDARPPADARGTAFGRSARRAERNAPHARSTWRLPVERRASTHPARMPPIHFTATDGTQTVAEDVVVTVTEARLAFEGTLRDDQGQPLPGVAVQLRGTKRTRRSLRTSADGSFRFWDPSGGDSPPEARQAGQAALSRARPGACVHGRRRLRIVSDSCSSPLPDRRWALCALHSDLRRRGQRARTLPPPLIATVSALGHPLHV